MPVVNMCICDHMYKFAYLHIAYQMCIRDSLMTEAPERVDPKQLEELGLELEEHTADAE